MKHKPTSTIMSRRRKGLPLSSIEVLVVAVVSVFVLSNRECQHHGFRRNLIVPFLVGESYQSVLVLVRNLSPQRRQRLDRTYLCAEASSRRNFMSISSAALTTEIICSVQEQQNQQNILFVKGASYDAIAAEPPALKFVTSQSGIQYADAKVGTGPIQQMNTIVSIDYVLSTTGARYGTKIFSSYDYGTPYRWKLGDGSTIVGLEQAIVGTDDIIPMRPGGIRRVIIPSSLAYETLKFSTSCGAATAGKENDIGPIPPRSIDTNSFESYQRFKNIYCNPNRQYQPDVVIDVKLYGKRTLD